MTPKKTKISNCKQLILQLKKRKQNPKKALENYPEAVYKKAEREIEFDRLSRLTIGNCRDE